MNLKEEIEELEKLEDKVQVAMEELKEYLKNFKYTPCWVTSMDFENIKEKAQNLIDALEKQNKLLNQEGGTTYENLEEFRQKYDIKIGGQKQEETEKKIVEDALIYGSGIANISIDENGNLKRERINPKDFYIEPEKKPEEDEEFEFICTIFNHRSVKEMFAFQLKSNSQITIKIRGAIKLEQLDRVMINTKRISMAPFDVKYTLNIAQQEITFTSGSEIKEEKPKSIWKSIAYNPILGEHCFIKFNDNTIKIAKYFGDFFEFDSENSGKIFDADYIKEWSYIHDFINNIDSLEERIKKLEGK